MAAFTEYLIRTLVQNKWPRKDIILPIIWFYIAIVPHTQGFDKKKGYNDNLNKNKLYILNKQ